MKCNNIIIGDEQYFPAVMALICKNNYVNGKMLCQSESIQKL
jgi:hypothetical protein